MRLYKKARKQDTNQTVGARTVKHGTHACYGQRTTPIIFMVRGQRSRSLWYVCTEKLVNKIQTEPLGLGPSNMVNMLVMTRERQLLFFKVRGQGSRSYWCVCICTQKLVNKMHTCLSVTLSVCLSVAQNFKQTFFKVRGHRSRSFWYDRLNHRVCWQKLVNKIQTEPFKHLYTKACKQDTDQTIWARTVKHCTNTCLGQKSIVVVTILPPF